MSRTKGRECSSSPLRPSTIPTISTKSTPSTRADSLSSDSEASSTKPSTRVSNSPRYPEKGSLIGFGSTRREKTRECSTAWMEIAIPTISIPKSQPKVTSSGPYFMACANTESQPEQFMRVTVKESLLSLGHSRRDSLRLCFLVRLWLWRCSRWKEGRYSPTQAPKSEERLSWLRSVNWNKEHSRKYEPKYNLKNPWMAYNYRS